MTTHSNIVTQDNLAAADRYFPWIYDTIKEFAGNKILDIGCARGNIADFFKAKELIIGIDVLDEFVSCFKDRFKENKNFYAYKINIEEGAEELIGRGIDTIICLNVLEHIEKDGLALENMRKILVKGGKLIVQVPAFNFLYGTLDEADLHFRRYEKKEIADKIKGAGFKIKKVFYFNLLGVLGWFLSGKVFKDKHFKAERGGLFNKFIPFLRFFEKIMKPPAGLSIFVIAEKE